MRINKLIFVLLISCLLLSCKEKNEANSELNLYMRSKQFGVNPVSATTFYQTRIVRQIFEGLYDYDYLKEPYQVAPLLADGFPEVSKDKLSYLIKIKKGIKFSDDPCFIGGKGKQVTASDIIYSLKHFVTYPPYNRAYFVYYIKGLMEYRTKAQEFFKNGGDLNHFIENNDVDGLELVDDQTIRISLRQVCPYFLETLTAPGASIISKEAVSYYGKDIDWHPVGTGPYILSSWGDGEKIVLLKNPDYRRSYYPDEGPSHAYEQGLLDDAGKRIPFVDKITIHFVKSDIDRKKLFDSGSIDIYTPEEDYFYEYFSQNSELTDKYKKKGVKSYIDSNVEFTGIMFNFNNPLIGKNQNLRKALALAYDNDKSISVNYYMSPVLAHWVIPPHIYGYEPSYNNPYSVYDMKKAATFLKSAGYPLGNNLPELVLLLKDTPALRRIGKFYSDSVSELGIKIRLEYEDSQEKIYARLSETSNPVHLFFVSEWSNFSVPDEMLRLFYKGKLKYKTNYSGYYNKEYEKLFEKVVKMDNGPQKMKVLNSMRDMVVSDCVFIPLSFTVLYRLYHEYVHNYKPHLLYFDRYKYIRVDMNEKRRYLKRK